MPVFYQQDVDAGTRLAVWEITEEEDFFMDHVPLHRNITHPHKRLQHLAGRYLLRFLFSDFPTALIRIADTKKPFLEDEAYHFSISHCGNFAAAIASKSKRVGIDIEVPSPRILRVSHKFLHPEEMELVGEPADILSATMLWSAKEAMFKWWGRGEVDFSHMLRLKGREGDEGCMQARFIKNEWDVLMDVHYKSFPGLVLAWAFTEP